VRLTSARIGAAGILALALLLGWAIWREVHRPAAGLSRSRAASLRPPADTDASKPPRGPETIANPDLGRVLQGRYVFEKNCVVCHGRWGDGRGEMAEGMRPKPRPLTSGVFKFRSTPSGFLPTDEDLEQTLRRGIANSSMPSFAHLPARDIQPVLAYLKTLSPKWQHRENYAVPIPPIPEPTWLQHEEESQPHRAAGSRLFVTHCAPCHGVHADGRSDLAAGLEDQWGEPCPPSDLTQDVLKCGPELRDLFQALTTGLDGTPMPSFAGALSDFERWEVVAYVASLRPSSGK